MLDYLIIFTFITLSTIHLISLGFFFEKFFLSLDFDCKKTFYYGISGLFWLGSISLILNFFIPINKNLNNIVFIIPIFYLLFNTKNIYINKEIVVGIFCISTISSLTIYLANNYTPDAGLYHLPFIKVLNDNKIIIGLTNINFTYGQSSFYQYISATYNNSLYKDVGITIPLVQIFSFIITTFIFFLIKNRKLNFHYLFVFLITSFCLMRLSRYSDLGNDGPAHLLFLYLAYTIFIILDKKCFDKYDFFQTILISTFIFIVKPTMGMVFLFNIYLVLKFKFYKFIKINITYYFLLFFIIFFLKNFLISGCLLFPLKITCFSKVGWYSNNIEYHGNSERVHDQGVAWTKGYPDQPIPQKTFKDYNKGFYWTKIWVKNHGKVILHKFFPFFLILLLTLFVINIKREEKQNCNNEIFVNNNKEINFLIAISGISTLIWFLQFPVLRYGLGYIALLTILVFLKLFYKNKINYKNIKIFHAMLIFLSLVIVFKNFSRIKKINNSYNHAPWPKIYSDKNLQNLEDTVIPVKINNKIQFYKPSKYNLCYYSLSPCTHFNEKKLLNEIYLKEIYGYKAYLLK